jgi:hypothetical protein
MTLVHLMAVAPSGDVVPVRVDAAGNLMQIAAGLASSQWTFASTGISNSTAAVTIAPAAGVGKMSCIDAIQLSADALALGSVVVIRDGAGGPVIWRHKIGAVGLLGGLSIILPVPLKSSPNTLLEFAMLTANITGSVYINAQGHVE